MSQARISRGNSSFSDLALEHSLPRIKRRGVLITSFHNKSTPGISEPPPLTPALIRETELLPSLKLKSRVISIISKGSSRIWVQHVAPAGQYPPCPKRNTQQ